MCFSATVSLTSSAFLVSVGALSVFNPTNRQRVLFAGIPFLFGFQQFCEALVWLSLKSAKLDGRGSWAVHLFLFFAFAVWPLWIPWSVLQAETVSDRRWWLRALTLPGVVVFVYALAALILGAPEVSVAGHSLRYELSDPLDWIPNSVQPLLYFSSAVLPMLMSTRKDISRMGWLILLSLILSVRIQRETLTSTWCFFSALISLGIATRGLLCQTQRQSKPEKVPQPGFSG